MLFVKSASVSPMVHVMLMVLLLTTLSTLPPPSAALRRTTRTRHQRNHHLLHANVRRPHTRTRSRKSHATTTAALQSFTLSLRPSCRSPVCQDRAVRAVDAAACLHTTLHPTLSLIRTQCPPPAARTLRRSKHFDSVSRDLAVIANSAAHYIARNKTFHRITRLHVVHRAHIARAANGLRIALHNTHKALRCTRPTTTPVTVYVVDTGCRVSHQELAGRTIALPAPGSSFATGDDDHGHGTHVASRIAGRHFGLAPHTAIVCIKALSKHNEGSSADVVSAINLASSMQRHRRGSAIISISLGVAAGPRYKDLDLAVTRAAEVGLVSIVAAGNSAQDACRFTPARAAGAITVAATRSDGRLADFSNYGSCVTVAAPGVNVWSAVGGLDDAYGTSSGTSMAAPYVSGIVALLLGEKGNLSTRGVAFALRDMASWNNEVGVVSVDGYCRWMWSEAAHKWDDDARSLLHPPQGRPSNIIGGVHR